MAIGALEITLIIVAIVLLFGAAKIPEIARALGRAKGEFEKGKGDGEREADEAARLRREAKDLGIAVEGKSPDELRRAIADARKSRPS